MNPSYNNNGIYNNGRAEAGETGLLDRVLKLTATVTAATLLLGAASCERRPEVVQPLATVVVRPVVQVERAQVLERTVEEAVKKYVDERFGYETKTSKELKDLKEGYDSLKARVESVEKTQDRISRRPITEESILIGKKDYPEIYGNLLSAILDEVSPERRESVLMNVNYMHLVPLGDSAHYNLNLIVGVTKAGTLVFIPPSREIDTIMVPKELIKTYVPPNVMQELLKYKIVKIKDTGTPPRQPPQRQR